MCLGTCFESFGQHVVNQTYVSETFKQYVFSTCLQTLLNITQHMFQLFPASSYTPPWIGNSAYNPRTGRPSSSTGTMDPKLLYPKNPASTPRLVSHKSPHREAFGIFLEMVDNLFQECLMKCWGMLKTCFVARVLFQHFIKLWQNNPQPATRFQYFLAISQLPSSKLVADVENCCWGRLL